MNSGSNSPATPQTKQHRNEYIKTLHRNNGTLRILSRYLYLPVYDLNKQRANCRQPI